MRTGSNFIKLKHYKTKRRNEMKMKFDGNENFAGDTTVPAGKYRLLFKGFERTTAKRTGTPQLKCDLEVLENSEFEGLEKKEYFPLDNNSLWRLKQFIAAVMDVSKLKDKEVDVETMAFNKLLEAAIGRSVFIYYGLEDYEGLERNFSRKYQKVDIEELALPPVGVFE
jgi:hypothetical protein